MKLESFSSPNFFLPFIILCREKTFYMQSWTLHENEKKEMMTFPIKRNVYRFLMFNVEKKFPCQVVIKSFHTRTYPNPYPSYRYTKYSAYHHRKYLKNVLCHSDIVKGRKERGKMLKKRNETKRKLDGFFFLSFSALHACMDQILNIGNQPS